MISKSATHSATEIAPPFRGLEPFLPWDFSSRKLKNAVLSVCRFQPHACLKMAGHPCPARSLRILQAPFCRRMAKCHGRTRSSAAPPGENHVYCVTSNWQCHHPCQKRSQESNRVRSSGRKMARQPQHGASPLTGSAADLHGTAMQFHDFLYDGHA